MRARVHARCLRDPRLQIQTSRLQIQTSRLQIPTSRLQITTSRLRIPTSRLQIPTSTAPRLRRFVHPQPTLWTLWHLRRCSSLLFLGFFFESGPDHGSLAVELEMCDGAAEVVVRVAQGDHELLDVNRRLVMVLASVLKSPPHPHCHP